MKSNSRDSPEGRPSEKLSTRTAMASVGSGRLKNSDLLKRHGCRTASGRGPSPTFSSAAPRSAQKRLVSGKDMCSLDTEVGSPPALTTSSSSREIASDSLPRSAPYMSTEDGWSTAPVAVTFKLAASSSGPVGAHDCHASMTATACEGGQARWKFVTLGAGTVRKTSDVTTPKLPAPAPRSAQNRVLVVGFVALDRAAVRQDDLRSGQVVGGHPVPPAEDPEPAAERQAGHPDRRTGAGGDRQVMLLQGLVHLAQPCAGTDPRQATRNRHRAHRRDVDDDPSGRGVPGEGVPSASHRVRQAVTACERDRCGDVVGTRAQRDGLGPNIVEPCVERLGQLLVGRRAGEDDLAGDHALKCLPAGRRTGHGSVSGLRMPRTRSLPDLTVTGWVLVAEEDDPVAEGPGLGEPEMDPGA